jgi:uncharacterized protein YecT (DUF1311 family)
MLAQRASDREIIRGVMGEMERSGISFNCDSCEGITPCIRYCTNKEFVRLDSLLGADLDRLLQAVEADSSRAMLMRHQQNWTLARREQCGIQVEDPENGHSMIRYVTCLNELTILRLNEIAILRESMVDP